MMITRNKKILLCSFAFCLVCVSVAVGVNTAIKDNAANVEYVADANSEIQPHDGDVLVDSLKLTSVPGTPDGISPAALVTSDDVSELENTDTYFQELRATVDMDRNQIISMLTDVMAEAESSAEKDNASTQKLKIIEYMEKEKMVENLITTKGLPDCFVLMTDNGVNVTVDKQELSKSEVAKVYDIVMRETGRDASQIVIQSKF